MTEAELTFGILVAENFYTSEDLKDEIARMKAESNLFCTESPTKDRQTSVLYLYQSLLKQNNGVVTKEIDFLLRTSAARNLIRKALEKHRMPDFLPRDSDHAEYEYLCYVWNILIKLQRKGILVRFYPIRRETLPLPKTNTYYMPERRVCFSIPDNKEIEAGFITSLYEKFPSNAIPLPDVKTSMTNTAESRFRFPQFALYLQESA